MGLRLSSILPLLVGYARLFGLSVMTALVVSSVRLLRAAYMDGDLMGTEIRRKARMILRPLGRIVSQL